jgi:hypothetical protein
MDSPVGWVGTESGMPGAPHIWSTGGNGAGDPSSSSWMPKCCDTTSVMNRIGFGAPYLEPTRPLVRAVLFWQYCERPQTVNASNPQTLSIRTYVMLGVHCAVLLIFSLLVSVEKKFCFLVIIWVPLPVFWGRVHHL